MVLSILVGKLGWVRGVGVARTDNDIAVGGAPEIEVARDGGDPR